MEKMISCCGTVCSECEYYPEECRRCQEIEGKVFWLEYTGESVCDIYECCHKKKKYSNCGQCEMLPCTFFEREDPTKTPEENQVDFTRQMENLRKYQALKAEAEHENIKKNSTAKEQDLPKEQDKPDDLQTIPGVGKNIAQHLKGIGIHCVADLVGKDPEELYTLDCLNKGFQEDRCQLYVFRCAVYYAEHEQRDPEKLKWWYWKDKEYPEKK